MSKLVWLAVSIGCLVVFLIVLWVCVDFYYIPSVNHLERQDCSVVDCYVEWRRCSYQQCTGTTDSRSCHTAYRSCWDAVVTLKLLRDGEEYYGHDEKTYYWSWSAYDRCDNYHAGKNVTCYFDSRHISKTLSLSRSGALSGPIATVVVFTICSFIALVAVIFVAVAILR